MSRIQKLLLFTDLFASLAIARLFILFVPFKHIASFMESNHNIKQTQAKNPNETLLKTVSGYTRKISKMTPWGYNCFAKALATKFFLNRKKIPSTIYFGVCHKGKQNKFKAHAWLKCGEIIITGAQNHEHYTVMKSFS